MKEIFSLISDRIEVVPLDLRFGAIEPLTRCTRKTLLAFQRTSKERTPQYLKHFEHPRTVGGGCRALDLGLIELLVCSRDFQSIVWHAVALSCPSEASRSLCVRFSTRLQNRVPQ